MGSASFAKTNLDLVGQEACIKRKCLKIAKSKQGGKVDITIHAIILLIEVGNVDEYDLILILCFARMVDI